MSQSLTRYWAEGEFVEEAHATQDWRRSASVRAVYFAAEVDAMQVEADAGLTAALAQVTKERDNLKGCRLVSSTAGERDLVVQLDALTKELAAWRRPYDQALVDKTQAWASNADSFAAHRDYIAVLEHALKQQEGTIEMLRNDVGMLRDEVRALKSQLAMVRRGVR